MRPSFFRRRHTWPRLTRDALLFSVGLAGVVYLMVTKAHPDSGLLVLLGGMMGLPAFLSQGDARKDDREPNREGPEAREWGEYERWRRDDRRRRWRG